MGWGESAKRLQKGLDASGLLYIMYVVVFGKIAQRNLLRTLLGQMGDSEKGRKPSRPRFASFPTVGNISCYTIYIFVFRITAGTSVTRDDRPRSSLPSSELTPTGSEMFGRKPINAQLYVFRAFGLSVLEIR